MTFLVCKSGCRGVRSEVGWHFRFPTLEDMLGETRLEAPLRHLRTFCFYDTIVDSRETVHKASHSHITHIKTGYGRLCDLFGSLEGEPNSTEVHIVRTHIYVNGQI